MGNKFVMKALSFLYMIPISAISESFYPIDLLPDGTENKVLCVYRDVYHKSHVLLYDMSNQTYEYMLSSQYNPTQIRLLPDGSGFSFIDNGIIKIKKFCKRSPKIIEIYEPLYEISNVEWCADCRSCVFQAKSYPTFGIYRTDLEGEIMELVVSREYDALYPNIIGELLFYIQIGQDQEYKVIQRNIITGADTVIYVSNMPLMHLKMMNETQGYVLTDELAEERTKCGVHLLLWCDEGQWRNVHVGDFEVERPLLVDKSRTLCDTFEPFFPRFSGSALFLPLEASTSRSFITIVRLQNLSFGRLLRSSLNCPSFCVDSRESLFFGSPIIGGCGATLLGVAW